MGGNEAFFTNNSIVTYLYLVIEFGSFFYGGIARDALIAANSTERLTVFDFGADSPASDSGVILVYQNGALEGRENDVITIWSR